MISALLNYLVLAAQFLGFLALHVLAFVAIATACLTLVNLIFGALSGAGESGNAEADADERASRP